MGYPMSCRDVASMLATSLQLMGYPIPGDGSSHGIPHQLHEPADGVSHEPSNQLMGNPIEPSTSPASPAHGMAHQAGPWAPGIGPVIGLFPHASLGNRPI